METMQQGGKTNEKNNIIYIVIMYAVEYNNRVCRE